MVDDVPIVGLHQEVIKLFFSRVVDLPAEIMHPEKSTSSVQHS